MYLNLPQQHHGWGQQLPPLHSQHPPSYSPNCSYHYGPPVTSSSDHHPPFPYQSPHTHHGPPQRSPHHGHYVNNSAPHQHSEHTPGVPRSSPSNAPPQQHSPYTSQSIHPTLVTPQTPRGPPLHQQHPIVTQNHHPNQHFSPAPAQLNFTQQEPIETVNLVTTKPPRPYTEYTMFYQLEREFILNRLLVDKDDTASQEEKEPHIKTALFKDDPLMPARYRTLPLRADWYISGKSKKPSKRKHRKTHGKIGFLELTRMIASRWANVDDETRKYCKMMSAMELVKYKEDVESYNLYKARLEKIGKVPEDVKEKEENKKAKEKRKEKTATSKDNASSRDLKKIDAVAVKSSGVATRSLEKTNEVAKNNVDTDIAEFITSLDDEKTHSSKNKKRAASPLPILHHEHVIIPPPPAAVNAKVITPERSAKRRRLPVHRAKPSFQPPTETFLYNGTARPDDDELIHMTFSGIDEAEIAREFYFPTHIAGISPRAPASPQAATLLNLNDASTHTTNQTTEALYGDVHSFDYWDALMDVTGDQAKVN